MAAMTAAYFAIIHCIMCEILTVQVTNEFAGSFSEK